MQWARITKNEDINKELKI